MGVVVVAVLARVEKFSGIGGSESEQQWESMTNSGRSGRSGCNVQFDPNTILLLAKHFDQSTRNIIYVTNGKVFLEIF